jgi:DNA-binding MarR family transcriptional regulator
MTTTTTTESRKPALGEALEFMRLVWALDHKLQSTSKQMSAKIGVTGLQRLAIRIIGKVPGCAPSELAELLHVHPSTLTGVLQRLTERGLIERKRDLEDARRSTLTLTPKGKRIDEVRSGTVEAAVRRALSKVTPRDLAAAERVLQALAAELTDGEED